MATTAVSASHLALLKTVKRDILVSTKLVNHLKSIVIARNAVSIGEAVSFMLKKKDKENALSSNHKQQPIKHVIRKERFPRSNFIDPNVVDWSDIMTVAQSYNPALVPMPIRMGRVRERKSGDPAPYAVNNIELLKIPNFLHLTPPAIEKQCKALKALCTPWPQDIGEHPLRYTTYNFIYPGPSVKHPDSRRVQLKVYLKDLKLDDHARRKMIILSGQRYNPGNDELTLVEDRCPTRVQNKEYVTYLLSALYHESLKTEPWELEHEEEIGKKSDAELRRLTEFVLEERPKSQRKQKIWSRVIGNQVMKFNRYGRAFVHEIKKHNIHGPVDRSLKDEIEREWKIIEGENS